MTTWPDLPSAVRSNKDELLRQLAASARLVAEISSYSMNRGVYAFFLVQGLLTIGQRVFAANNATPLYIGKTESSQKARDAGQHLSDDGTGSSTLRRSLGAILLEQLRLKPEARSDSEISARRFTNYRFAKAGEEQLTKWMNVHLSLAFCELPKLTIPELRVREERLIRSAAPPLNIHRNSGGLLCRSQTSKEALCRVGLGGGRKKPIVSACFRKGPFKYSTMFAVVRLPAHLSSAREPRGSPQ